MVTKAAIQNVRSIMSKLADCEAGIFCMSPFKSRFMSTAASKYRSVTGESNLLMASQYFGSDQRSSMLTKSVTVGVPLILVEVLVNKVRKPACSLLSLRIMLPMACGSCSVCMSLINACCIAAVGGDFSSHSCITLAVCFNTLDTASSEMDCFIITNKGHRKNTTTNKINGASIIYARVFLLFSSFIA